MPNWLVGLKSSQIFVSTVRIVDVYILQCRFHGFILIIWHSPVTRQQLPDIWIIHADKSCRDARIKLLQRLKINVTELLVRVEAGLLHSESPFSSMYMAH